MATLPVGTEASDFVLPLVGGGAFCLSDALTSGAVLLVFIKTNCPVCRYALPFVDRIYAAYRDQGLTVLAVSQNPEQETAKFREANGISFASALDDRENYRVSNAYGITNTPTAFLIDQSRLVAVSSVGWSREEMLRINVMIAGWLHSSVGVIFRADEDVAAWKPG